MNEQNRKSVEWLKEWLEAREAVAREHRTKRALIAKGAQERLRQLVRELKPLAPHNDD